MNKLKKITSVRGMKDIIPDDIMVWRNVESLLINILHGYSYEEIRTPIVEKTQLFAHSIGKLTDIVENEMYSFLDFKRRKLSLRPEATSGVVRACIEHGLLCKNKLKLWYMGPMFRYERPQKCRHRQFQQLGVEIFGYSEPIIDAELIMMLSRMWSTLGISKELNLEINSIGSYKSRINYMKCFTHFLKLNKDKVNTKYINKINRNPLRILDSKDKNLQSLLKDAPKMLDFIDTDSRNHFNKLCELLNKIGICYNINQNLVRGLNYYNNTVFEWTTDKLGAQNSICGGGRYDQLVSMLGGSNIPAIGCAIGMNRLISLIKFSKSVSTLKSENTNIYVISSDSESHAETISFVDKLRMTDSSFSIMTYYFDNKYNEKKILMKAVKHDVKFVLIIKSEMKDYVTVINIRTRKNKIFNKNDILHVFKNYIT